MIGNTVEYAELQVTSNFSFLRGASHPDELVRTAAALGHQAIAITDRNSLAGMVRAHQAAKEAGIRLVVGVRLDLARRHRASSPIPQDRAAYGRLTRLLTLGKRRAPKGECHLDYADVVAHGEGQIVVVLPPESGWRCRRVRRPGRGGFPRPRLSRRASSLSRRRCAAASPASPRRRDSRAAARRDRRRALPRARAAAAAGCADLHPRALHDRRGRVSPRRQCRAPSEAGGRDGAAVPRPRGRAGAQPRDRPRAAVSASTNCATNTPKSRCRDGHDAATAPRRARLGRRRRAFSADTMALSAHRGRGRACRSDRRVRGLAASRVPTSP